MRGQKGMAVKCEVCGHEDVIIFQEHGDLLKKLIFKVSGKKCSECGGQMTGDKSKQILF
jgi:DNA-directed RNA polymerase subunit RPC12/RpoP